MKFKAKASNLIGVLDVVSIVTPRPITPQQGSGYLFVVRGDRCYVYSRDTTCVSRADFPIEESDGDGSFVYPAANIDALKFLGSGEVCTFEASQKDEMFVVKYESGSGASSERTSFDPQLLSTCDEDLKNVKIEYKFPSGLLKESISMGRPFLAKAQDTKIEEQFKAVQVFDKEKPDYAKGDGHLFVSNSIQAFYFYCEAFCTKSLEVHGQHLPALLAFLAKSPDEVTVQMGDHYTFVTNANGHVFGWPKHAKSHGKFGYYGLKNDNYVLHVPKSVLLNALKYTRSEMDAKSDKIKVVFDHKTDTLQFRASEEKSKVQSPLVPIRSEAKKDEDFVSNVNIDHMISLVDGVKANEVQLRVCLIEKEGAKAAMFRTIDDFRMDKNGKVVTDPEGSFKCRVTRFMPSKE